MIITLPKLKFIIEYYSKFLCVMLFDDNGDNIPRQSMPLPRLGFSTERGRGILISRWSNDRFAYVNIVVIARL